jgi:hypothetical protein
MKPLSERTARLTIGMMRSMANCKPISPFHLEASYEMERLLNEVMEYRKQNESKNKPKENTKKTSLQQNNYMVSCTDPCKVGKVKRKE